ncbi:MAG: hypothetical protein ACI88H_001245 [Cocleimonas sp.]
MDLLVSEFNEHWETFPVWASFFFDVGYNWQAVGHHQLAIFSVPQKCAAAGFITLGLVCRELEGELKNNLDKHFINMCSKAKKSKEIQFSKVGNNRVYSLSEVAGDSIKVFYMQKPVKKNPFPTPIYEYILKNNACDWYLHGNVPMVLNYDNEYCLDKTFYALLTGCPEKINDSNLRHSYSNVIYVSGSRADAGCLLSTIRLKFDTKIKNLSELITLEATKIKRILAFYSSTMESDRMADRPRVAVFDSIDAQKSMDDPFLADVEDKIFVINQQDSDAKIDNFVEQIKSKQSWFIIDGEKTEYLSKTSPSSISTIFLKENM